MPARCGFARRVVSLAYDLLLLVSVLIFATMPLMWLTHGHAIHSGNPAYDLYLLVLCYLYFCWPWVKGGQTLGMRAWHVRVAREDGGNPGWREASLRFAFGLLSILTIGAGFIWALVDRDGRALHDRGSRTRLLVDVTGNPARA